MKSLEVIMRVGISIGVEAFKEYIISHLVSLTSEDIMGFFARHDSIEDQFLLDMLSLYLHQILNDQTHH